MYCSNCGEEIHDEVNFCPHCGEEVMVIEGEKTEGTIEGDEVQHKTTITCPKCESEIMVDLEECPDCGKKLEEKTEEAKEVTSEGLSLCREGKYEQGIKKFNEAIEIYPKHTKAYLNKGLALSKLGRYDEALKALDNALAIEPDNHKLWIRKGDVLKDSLLDREASLEDYLTEGDMGDVGLSWSKCIDKALEIKPDSKTALEKRAEDMIPIFRHFPYSLIPFEEKQKFDELLELDDENLAVLTLKFEAELSEDKEVAALETAKKTIELHPKDYRGYINKCRALNNLGRYDEAIKSAQKATKLNNRKKEVWFYRAEALKGKQGKIGNILTKDQKKSFKKTVECYNRALKIDEKGLGADRINASAWSGKADSLAVLGKHERAIDTLGQAINQFPNDSSLWVQKARIFHNMNKKQKAKRAVEKALELDPTNYEAIQLKSQIRMDEMSIF